MSLPAVDIAELLPSPEYREELAERAYYRERQDQLAAEREQELSEEYEYFVIAWEDVSDFGKQPYRTAVAEVCDRMAEHIAA